METIIFIKKPAAKIKYLNFFYKKKEKVFFAITYHKVTTEFTKKMVSFVYIVLLNLSKIYEL